MPSNLTDRQIRRMHQLYRDGISKRAIAGILQVNRNTVHTHLTGRVAYRDELARAIGLSLPKLCTANPMSIYSASEYLPGAPRPISTRMLHKAGILRAKIARCGKYKTKMLVASHADIRKAARALLPPGMWIRGSRLKDLTQNDDELFSFLTQKAKEVRSMSNRFFLWPDIVTKAISIGIPLSPAPHEISRALKTLDLTGVGWL